MTFPGHVPRLAWPADPGRGITAYFLDPDYEKVFSVPHYAVDYRLSQGTALTAAAPGVVYKARDNGMGYSYIMLAHSGGLTTVYGHISRILVREGDLVSAGDLIGMSGGSPGTAGAGYMTTGPHLHFEVYDNGEHRDPLAYLPLEPLPLADIPQKYLDEAKKIEAAEAEMLNTEPTN
jgi:murein DD-endopeptidase MepM/ murein hydrolase activator NlpD